MSQSRNVVCDIPNHELTIDDAPCRQGDAPFTRTVSDCLGLASGTIASLIHSPFYSDIEPFQEQLVAFAQHHPEFATWQAVFEAMKRADLVPNYRKEK